MEKKTIIIISLLSTVFSLIYVMLSYFGFTRYLGMYFFSIEKYGKNYKNLDKIGKDRIVISLAITTKQKSKLSKVIKSLLDQTVRVDLITLIVPNKSDYQYIENFVSIFKCGKDQGILNCLIPSIIRENESTTRIITLGDNTIYGKDFIETLMEKSEKYPDSIIYSNNSNTNSNSNTIDLTKGVVFSTKFFNTDFIDVPKGVNGNKWVNDYFKNFSKEKIIYKENYKIL